MPGIAGGADQDFDAPKGLAMTELVQVLGRLLEDPIAARQLQASEKRQGSAAWL